MTVETATAKRYNGWTNYETWLVALWLDNDEYTQREAHQMCRRVTDYRAADLLKSYVSDDLLSDVQDAGGFAADLVGAALSEVDWLEIAEHYQDDNEPDESEDEDEDE